MNFTGITTSYPAFSPVKRSVNKLNFLALSRNENRLRTHRPVGMANILETERKWKVIKQHKKYGDLCSKNISTNSAEFKIERKKNQPYPSFITTETLFPGTLQFSYPEKIFIGKTTFLPESIYFFSFFKAIFLATPSSSFWLVYTKNG